MEMSLNTCALCGKTIEKPEKSVYKEVINGMLFVFDSQSCLEMFRKFQIVYGDTFVAQHALNT
jgi:YHS domain-containing protein